MKPSLQRRLQRDIAIIEQLAKRWPRCFVLRRDRRRPLKIGIHDDIVAQLDVALPGVSLDELKRAMCHYVRNSAYHSKLTLGAERIDLDGAAVGVVTEAEVVHGLAKHAEIRAARKRKREAQKAQAQKVQPPPTAPPRDGLAQLRAAAQRRKESLRMEEDVA
jgi:ProP effector